MERLIYEKMLEAAKRQMFDDILNKVGYCCRIEFDKPVTIGYIENGNITAMLCHAVEADDLGMVEFEVSGKYIPEDRKKDYGEILYNYTAESIIDIIATIDDHLSKDRSDGKLTGLATSKLNEEVTVICYNAKEKMTRREALEKYYEGMRCSEGCEHQRYESIFFQLLNGEMTADDKIPYYEAV